MQNHVPLLSRLPIPVSHLLGHFLPRKPTSPHLHRLIGRTPIASTYGRFDHLWKQTTRVGCFLSLCNEDACNSCKPFCISVVGDKAKHTFLVKKRCNDGQPQMENTYTSRKQKKTQKT